MKKTLFILLLILCFSIGLVSFAESDIKAIQTRLLDLNFDIGAADGIAGSKTTKAITIAQQLLSDAGYEIEVTGTADEATYALLMDSRCETLLRTLTLQSFGKRVKAVQNRLVDLHFYYYTPDGNYGKNTQNAVLSFETWAVENDIPLVQEDGKLTTDEYDLLMSDLSTYGLITPGDYNADTPLLLQQEHLYSKSAILINAVTGDVFFQKDPDLQLEPASTTKIVTLLTALMHQNISEEITIPDCAAKIPDGSSLVPVSPGEKMTMLDLLYAMIIRSGNDAANAVAELCSGSIDTFVEEMNQTAVRIGMTNSHFSNPHGFHEEGHYSTARDLAIAARYGLLQPDFLKIVTCLSYTLPATSNRKELKIQITHEIFDPESEYYIPYAAGIKSGYTSNAGYCYVGAYQKDQVTLIAVVLGNAQRMGAWKDLKKLFSYGEAFAKAVSSHY